MWKALLGMPLCAVCMTRAPWPAPLIHGCRVGQTLFAVIHSLKQVRGSLANDDDSF